MRTLKDIKTKLSAQYPQTLSRHYVQQYDCYMDIITKETALFLSTEEILFRQLFKGGSIKRLPDKMEELFRDAVLIPDLKKHKLQQADGTERVVMVDETDKRFVTGIAYKYWRQFSYPGTAVYTKPGSSMYILMDRESMAPYAFICGVRIAHKKEVQNENN